MKRINYIFFYCLLPTCSERSRTIAYCLLIFSSCSKDKIPVGYNGYPEEVGKLMLRNCATAGCHNDASYDASAGLNLSSWEKLFAGYKYTAAVVPFSSDQSPLMFFINTFSDLGVQLQPTMPINAPAFSKEEVTLIRDWIANGAPDETGFVKFSDNPNRKKFYVVNQGCDLVAVFDVETKLVMRYVKVGTATSKSPHMVKISPDGQFWYVSFYAGDVLQKFRTSDDTKVGEINIGYGSWNTFTISPDSKKAYVVDWEPDGKIAVADLVNMQKADTWGGSGLFVSPHGSAINQSGTTLYVTAQYGNFIYKIPVSDPGSDDQIVLAPGEMPTTTSELDPHDMLFSPDETKYFVTCQKSGEVRILQTNNDSLLAVIAGCYDAKELSISKTTDYLFVSCMDDTINFAGKRGSVAIINYQTNSLVKRLFSGYQPHGLAVDDDKKLVYVANRNANPNGPAPHHTSTCGGRNGYVTIIDMSTLDLFPGYKAEVSPDAYSVAIRK